MKYKTKNLVFLSLFIFSLGGFAQSTYAEEHATNDGIAWRKDNDLDAAFAQAKASKRPVFLYWGAVWCPPCNQVKATIFNRKDFVEKSRHFVPVYLDGDTPGAQKLAAQFKVRGYPTMILFKPDGTEITRLPGEVDAQRYVQVLSLAMNTNGSVEESLRQALTGDKKLNNNEWRLLADYSWDDPQQKLIPTKDLAQTLMRLAEKAPAGDNAMRLQTKALVALANAQTAPKLSAPELEKANDKMLKLLKDGRLARANMDLLAGAPTELVGLLTATNSAARSKLKEAMSNALTKLADDKTLSKTERLTAINAQVNLATMDKAKPSTVLQAEVKLGVAQIDKATTDGYERQSVVNAAAHALGDAGLMEASDELLTAELKRSHSPYYFMSTLGANAKKRGDTAAAANWYEQAYNASKGPATRLQWGANYVTNLVDLVPTDEARIEKAVQNVFAELSGTENAFYERNRNYLEKMSKKLMDWNAGGKHQTAVLKMKTQLDEICNKLPANDNQRATCSTVLPIKT
ncbi:MAG: thioredoxin family protein [Burkholderiaceae bacterium]|nr:thioredoxin family protein [Burkholderiaceae bacterium]